MSAGLYLKLVNNNSHDFSRENWFNYFNMTEVDISGTFRFLTDELQDAEDIGDRGFISLHVLLINELNQENSLDFRPCSQRLGRDQHVDEPIQSL